MNEALDFPLPPTTSPPLSGPPLTRTPPAPAAIPAPLEADELTTLREKVAELDQVVALAKTRVETLGAEKRLALERAGQLEAQLEAAQLREAELLARLGADEAPRTFDDTTIAELLARVAALEAVMAPSRAA